MVQGFVWRLSQGAAIGQIVTVRCVHCNISRHYLPQDLAKVFGDVGVDRIDGNMRCEVCHKREYIVATVAIPLPADRQRMTIRRLAGIKMVRRIVWRDEPP